MLIVRSNIAPYIITARDQKISADAGSNFPYFPSEVFNILKEILFMRSFFLLIYLYVIIRFLSSSAFGISSGDLGLKGRAWSFASPQRNVTDVTFLLASYLHTPSSDYHGPATGAPDRWDELLKGSMSTKSLYSSGRIGKNWHSENSRPDQRRRRRSDSNETWPFLPRRRHYSVRTATTTTK